MLDGYETIEDILEIAKSDSVADRDKVSYLISQWQTPMFLRRMRFLDLDRKHGDMQLMIEDARQLREDFIAKAASLYLTLGEAINEMDYYITKRLYVHATLRSLEKPRLSCDSSSELKMTLGTYSNNLPVVCDFDLLSHLFILQDHRSRNLPFSFNEFFMLPLNKSVARIPNAQCVLIGRSFESECILAVPPATSNSESFACLDWLRKELEERKHYFEFSSKRYYPLFVFVYTYQNKELLYLSNYKCILDECSKYNVHFIFAIDMPLFKRDPTLEEKFLTELTTCMESNHETYGAIVVDDIKRKHLLYMKELDSLLGDPTRFGKGLSYASQNIGTIFS